MSPTDGFQDRPTVLDAVACPEPCKEAAGVGGSVSQNLDALDETRTFNEGELAVITSGSACGKPIVGTGSCAAAHFGYVVSGRLHVEMGDGTAADAGPGDLFDIAPGHDAWIVGDEPCVVIDFERSARSDASEGCR